MLSFDYFSLSFSRWNLISVLWLITLPIMFVQRNNSASEDQIFFFALVLVLILIILGLLVLGRFIRRKFIEYQQKSKHELIILNFNAPKPDSTIVHNLTTKHLSIREQLDQDQEQEQETTKVKRTTTAVHVQSALE
jgi:uncharacterized integral membrane protein